jgi:hypothetical protein
MAAVNHNGKRKNRIWLWGSLVAGVVLILAVTAFALRAGGASIPAARLGNVTRGDIAKSVVATGPIQPITKVELKSRALGLDAFVWLPDAKSGRIPSPPASRTAPAPRFSPTSEKEIPLSCTNKFVTVTITDHAESQPRPHPLA